MINENINTLIKKDKVEEALKILESHVKTLPEIFQDVFSIQYSSYTEYKWEALTERNDKKDLNRLKYRLLEFSRSIASFEETGKIPIEIDDEYKEIKINNSKNFNTGNIQAGGNVNIGDN